jgi:hypothetical protein
MYTISSCQDKFGSGAHLRVGDLWARDVWLVLPAVNELHDLNRVLLLRV